MQDVTYDPRYVFDIEEDPQTGEYVATIPMLGATARGTFEDVSAWALEQLAAQYGVADPLKKSYPAQSSAD